MADFPVKSQKSSLGGSRPADLEMEYRYYGMGVGVELLSCAVSVCSVDDLINRSPSPFRKIPIEDAEEW